MTAYRKASHIASVELDNGIYPDVDFVGRSVWEWAGDVAGYGIRGRNRYIVSFGFCGSNYLAGLLHADFNDFFN